MPNAQPPIVHRGTTFFAGIGELLEVTRIEQHHNTTLVRCQLPTGEIVKIAAGILEEALTEANLI